MSGSRTTTTNLRAGSPGVGRRGASAKSTPSVRSSKQTSDVREYLSVAPISKGKKPSSAGPKFKNQILDGASIDKKNLKPKLAQSLNMKKSKSSPEKKSNSKPAWAVKQSPNDEKTDRSDLSGGTFTLGGQDSLNNFNYSEYPEDDQHLSALTNNNISYSKNITKKDDPNRKSLFEFLTDTNRTDVSEQSNRNVTDTGRTMEPVCWNTNLDSCDRTDNRNVFNNLSDGDSDFEIVKDFTEYNNNKISRNETQCDPLTDSGLSSTMDIGSIKSWSSSTNKLPPKRNISNSKKDISKPNLKTKPGIQANLTNIRSKNKGEIKSSLRPTTSTNKSKLGIMKKSPVKENEVSNITPSYKNEIQISFLEKRELAAKTIQVWWRKVNIRRKAGAAAMKRMMENKQRQLEEKLTKQRQKKKLKQNEEHEQMKRLEEMARAVRQSVISEMQNKRALEIKRTTSI